MSRVASGVSNATVPLFVAAAVAAGVLFAQLRRPSGDEDRTRRTGGREREPNVRGRR